MPNPLVQSSETTALPYTNTSLVVQVSYLPASSFVSPLNSNVHQLHSCAKNQTIDINYTITPGSNLVEISMSEIVPPVIVFLHHGFPKTPGSRSLKRPDLSGADVMRISTTRGASIPRAEPQQ